MTIKDVDSMELKDNRTLVEKAVEYSRTQKEYKLPKTLTGKRKITTDACIKNVLSGFTNDLMYAGAPKFLGYAMLSNISQEALIRAGVETTADEMTRSLYELDYDGDEPNEELINKLNNEAEKYKLVKRFNNALCKMGYFGGCLLYIDMGDLDDDELMEPLILDKKTFKKGAFRGFKVIEPVNITAGTYNSSDPLDDNYFKPEFWYIQGRPIHSTRFLYISKNDAPLLLKPAYNFFGIPDAQLVLDYVAHFVENRESAQELLHKFSLTCFGTDLTQVLAGQSLNDLVKRMKMFNKMKNNGGTFVFDKEKEEVTQLNTPLSGVRDIVDMSLNLLCAIFRIPKVKLLGEGEGGLNNSSKEQMRSFYDYILGLKEKVIRNPLEDAFKILQLNLGLEPDECLRVKFPPMWDMDDSERAELNKMKADTMIGLINAGVISQEEARKALSLDEDSGFSSIDPDDIPEDPQQNLEEERFEFEKEQSSNKDDKKDEAEDEFKELEHPRDKTGRFIDKVKSKLGFKSDSKSSIAKKEDKIQEIKKIIQNLSYEKGIGYSKEGNLIIVLDGNEEEIKIKEEQLKKLEDGIFIHNHPNGGPFSPVDLETACQYNIKNMIVISRYGEIYRLEIKDKEKVRQFAQKLSIFIPIAIERNKELVSKKVELGIINVDKQREEQIKETIKDFEKYYTIFQKQYGYSFIKE